MVVVSHGVVGGLGVTGATPVIQLQSFYYFGAIKEKAKDGSDDDHHITLSRCWLVKENMAVNTTSLGASVT